MNILWSPEAVEAAQARLTRAKQALEDCVSQSTDMRAVLLDTSDGGEPDKALMKALDRFDEIAQRISKLNERTGDYSQALLRANANFETAEGEVLQMAKEIEGTAADYRVPDGHEAVAWTPVNSGTMPEMRENVWVLPDWLDREVMMSTNV